MVWNYNICCFTKILGCFVILTSFGISNIFAQEDSLCLEKYDSVHRTLPLGDQQISHSITISKLVCTYYEQNSSKVTFEVSWSPSGKIYGSSWCTELLTVENGIGSYQSNDHYVKILANGILPQETEYAMNFMQTLSGIVEDFSQFCDGQRQPMPDIEKSEEKNNSFKTLDLSNENSTINKESVSQPVSDDLFQYYFEIIIVAVIIIIGFLAYKKFKK